MRKPTTGPAAVPKSLVHGVSAARRAGGTFAWTARGHDGEGKEVWLGTYDTKQQAEEAKAHWERTKLFSAEGGLDPREPLSTVAERWLTTIKSTQSYMGERGRVMNHILRPFKVQLEGAEVEICLGRMAVSQIRPDHIDQLMNSWSHLAPATRQGNFKTLNALFAKALSNDQIIKNPCAKGSVIRPKGKVREVLRDEIWKDRQMATVTESIREDFVPFPWLGSGLGLRQGEIFGFDPLEDIKIDEETGQQVLVVNRQVLLYGPAAVPVFCPPKAREEGFTPRRVPLPKTVAAVLEEFMATYEPIRVTLPWYRGIGRTKVEDMERRTFSLLFVSREGKPINKNYFNNYIWKPALAAAGLPNGPRQNGSHALRHYFACRALDSGVKPTTLAYWLGHKDAAFTVSKYGKLQPGGAHAQASPMDAVYGRDAFQGPGSGLSVVRSA